MDNRKLIVAAILLLTCVLAFALTYLLLQSTELASVACVGVLSVGLIFAQPFIGIANYLIFLYVRPQEYVEILAGVRIMLLIGVTTFALMILHMTVKKRAIALTPGPQNLLMVWFLLAIAVSQLAHFYVMGAWEAMQDFFSTMVMFLLITNLVDNRHKLGIAVNLVVLLTLFLAGQGIYQYFTGAGIGGEELAEGRIQAVGIFNDPNDLALAFVIVVPYLFLRLVEGKKPRERVLAFLALAILVYALFLTASRGGMLSFGMLIIILLSRKFGKAQGIILGSLVMIAVFALGPRMMTISTDEASAYGRIEAWSIGMSLFGDFPLFGVGSGSFNEYHYITAHNSFILCAAELGIFGLFPWMMMIYLSIKNNNFVSRHSAKAGMSDITIYSDAVRYGLMGFAMAAFFLSRTYNDLLFILIGFSVASTHLFVKESAGKYQLIESRDFIYTFGLIVGMWMFTKVFLMLAW